MNLSFITSAKKDYQVRQLLFPAVGVCFKALKLHHAAQTQNIDSYLYTYINKQPA